MNSNALVVRDPAQHGKVSVTDKGRELITDMAAEGQNLVAIAHSLSISKSTFAELRKRDEHTADAYELGLSRFEHECVQGLLAASRGELKGSFVPLIFMLKAKCGWREGEKKDTLQQSNVVINLPAPMSLRDYEKAIDIEVKNAD